MTDTPPTGDRPTDDPTDSHQVPVAHENKSPEEGTPSDIPTHAEMHSERALFTPPIDIYETEEGLVLLADLPGVSRETVELQVQDNKLTLFGRVDPLVPEHSTLRHQEYHVGDFLRSFILSDDVDHERITAKFSHGVLTVTLPRLKNSEPRRIHVD